MNNKDLARELAEHNGITYKLANQIMEEITTQIMVTVKHGDTFQFIGFGKFVPFLRHAREGVNPQNPSERIHMKEVLTVKFRAGKRFKDTLKEKQ